MEEIAQHLSQQRPVTLGGEQRADPDLELPISLGLGAPQLVGHHLRHFGHIDARRRELLAAEAGKRQQIVDQLTHAPGVLVDHSQQTLRLGFELRLVVFEENPGKAMNRAERRAQIVRHRVRERLQLRVRPLECLCALRHLRFQVVM